MVNGAEGIGRLASAKSHEIHLVDDIELAGICSKLIRLYARELGEDLGFQQLESELQNPLKKYGPPGGLLLLATTGGTPSGCVAYQKISDDVCEMKRLYVEPGYRSTGIAALLVNQLCKTAQQRGYKTMVLDTLKRLKPALELYTKLGFYTTRPYYHNPLPDVVFMEKIL